MFASVIHVISKSHVFTERERHTHKHKTLHHGTIPCVRSGTATHECDPGPDAEEQATENAPPRV